jgi:hypothetical protein
MLKSFREKIIVSSRPSVKPKKTPSKLEEFEATARVRLRMTILEFHHLTLGAVTKPIRLAYLCDSTDSQITLHSTSLPSQFSLEVSSSWKVGHRKSQSSS